VQTPGLGSPGNGPGSNPVSSPIRESPMAHGFESSFPVDQSAAASAETTAPILDQPATNPEPLPEALEGKTPTAE
jgi:hypothetical protein